MVKIIRSEKPVGFKALSVVTYFCSIMYYLSDNILWILSIFVKSKVIDVTQSRLWKDRKNFFSLSRIVAYFLILSYEIWLQKLENDKNIAFLQNQTPESEDIEKENKAYVELIDGRRKNRFVFI